METAYQSIDADDLAIDVDQRAATVPRVDVRVRLNEILVHENTFTAQNYVRTAFGAHMAIRHRIIEAEWRSDRDGKFAHTRPGRVRQSGHRQALGFDFDHRHI